MQDSGCRYHVNRIAGDLRIGCADRTGGSRIYRNAMNWIWILLLCGILMGITIEGKAAYTEPEFTDASVFYQKNGSRQLIFHDGAFYYGSRGKAGDPGGLRYGVSGQRFTMRMENGGVYTVEVALDEIGHPGTCRRISYIKKDEYYYSLYQVLYDDIYGRLQKKYSWVDFDSLMYNHWVYVQADFLLTCVRNGNSDGYVIEQGNGMAYFQGTIYENAAQILEAAEWSAETQKALPEYFGIQMNIFQPSVYYIVFHRNSAGPEGDMPKQQFLYGKTQKLNPCKFKKEFQIHFDTQGMMYEGKELQCDAVVLKSRFKGWGLAIAGDVSYQDGQQVQNLSSKNNDTIHLYALWEDQELIFPKLEADNCRLAGWCTSVQELYKKQPAEEEMKAKKIYLPESRIKPYKDELFYAVWRKKNYRVQFEDPCGAHPDDEKRGSAWQIHYDLPGVEQIRAEIVNCRFAGQRLNQALAAVFIPV